MCNSYMREPAPNPPVLSRDAAPSAWTSSDKSKESLVCTHRGTNAVRVLIELTRCSRAHAAATWRWCCGSCTCTPVLSGMSTRTTVMGSKDLGGCSILAPAIGIANCLAAGCARRARGGRRHAVEEVVERRATLAKDCRTALRMQGDKVKQKTRSCGGHRVHASMHHHQFTSGSCQICLLKRGVTNQGGRAGEQETRPL